MAIVETNLSNLRISIPDFESEFHEIFPGNSNLQHLSWDAVEIYKQVSVLGSGAFGVVSLVEHINGKRFARKQATSHFSNTHVEAEMMELVKGHDNIVQLIDVIPSGAGVDLIIELCDGNLLELIQEKDGLEIEIVKDLALDIGRALQFMRSKKISHCDLKPENILYKKDQSKKSGFRFLVADFGNATIGDFIDYRIQTCHYRCSENILASMSGNESLNQITSCDYYSLGCILFEAITTQYLFSNTEDEEIYLYDQLCFSFYDFFVLWSDMPELFLHEIRQVKKKDPDFYIFLINFYEYTLSEISDEIKEEVHKDSFILFKEKVDPSFHNWFDFIKQLVYPFPKKRLQGEKFFEHDVFQ